MANLLSKKFRNLLVLSLCINSFLAIGQDAKAIKIINEGIQQMGGEALLASINSIQTQGKQVYFLVDQSIRPKGPFFTSVNNYKSLKLPKKNKLAYWIFYGQSGQGVKYLVDGDAFGVQWGNKIGFMPYGSDLDEELYLAPEKILFNAREANPVFIKDTILQDVYFSVIGFKWKTYPIRLFFNAQSNYLSQVEITRHYHDNTAFVWGDIKMVHSYSYWKKINKQMHYPAQKDTYLDGLHFQSFSIDSVFINRPFWEDSLSIPDSVKTKIIKSANRANMFTNVPTLSAKEIMPNIFFIAGKNTSVGSYNACFIKTENGIIVIEAPVSSAYTKAVINTVYKQFPNEKIKAVITTSDAWPHIGGLREYAANNIPIYNLGINENIIKRLLQSSFYTHPDSLQKKKIKPVLKNINEKLALGDEGNLIEIYPIKTESGERMMMIYFPKHKLLYTSDLVQPGQGEKFFMPQYIGEIIEAVNREKLQVEKVIGLHQTLIDYKELVEFMK